MLTELTFPYYIFIPHIFLFANFVICSLSLECSSPSPYTQVQIQYPFTIPLQGHLFQEALLNPVGRSHHFVLRTHAELYLGLAVTIIMVCHVSYFCLCHRQLPY